MRRRNVLITDFSAGEISRKFDGRVDLSIYKRGCSTMENFIVLSQGGATYRPGTKYVAEVKTSSYATRLVPFIRSADEVYLIEFGHQYFRVYKPHERSGAVEVATSYVAADLFELKFRQIDDDLWIVHPDYLPQKITYTSATSWAIANVTFTGGGLFTAGATGDYPRAIAFYQNRIFLAGTDNDPATIFVSKEGSYTDFTISSPLVAGDAMELPIFTERGNQIVWMQETERGIAVGSTSGEFILLRNGDGVISAVNIPAIQLIGTLGCADIQGKHFSDRVFYVQHGEKYIRDFYSKDDIASQADHILGDDGVVEIDYTETPYPALWVVREDGELAVLAYNKNRKVFAWSRIVTEGYFESIAVVPRGTKDEVWLIVKRNIGGSDKRFIEYFSDFEYEEQTDYHMVDCGTFYDGGTDDISALTAETVQDITNITRANPAVVTCAGHGYSNGDTVRIDDVEGMIEINGREFTVAGAATDTFQLSGIDSSTYTAYSAGGKVVKTPNIAVTMSTALATLGWANNDYVYLKDIGGMTELNERRFKIEGVSGSTFDIDTGDTRDYTAYVSGGTARKVVNEVTGLNEINGEDVSILADGGIHASETVATNKAELDGYYNKVHVGLKYTGKLQTMRIEAGAMLKKKRISKVRSRFVNTLGVSIGPDEDNLEEIVFVSGDDIMGSPPALYTGDKEMHFPGDWGTENYIYIEHDDPTPMTLVALGADMVIGG